VHKSSV